MADQLIDPQSRILFIRTDRLGETVLNLPVVAGLKAALPEATITFLSRPDLTDLITRAPDVDRVMGYSEDADGWWGTRALRLARRLRPERYAIAIISNPKKEFHLAAALAGIPVRVGYDRKWGWLLNRRIPDLKMLGERHEVEYNQELVTALGLPVSIPSWRFPPFRLEQDQVLQLLVQQGVKSQQPLIIVHPWTSNPVKRWPAERFRSVLQRVSERSTAIPVVIGGPEERSPGAALLSPPIPGVINLIGRLSVIQLTALLQRAQVLLSNDSGPVHVAAAAGTPTVVLFGAGEPSTGPGRWGPWGAGHLVLTGRSLTDIEVDEVMQALEQQLERARRCAS